MPIIFYNFNLISAKTAKLEKFNAMFEKIIVISDIKNDLIKIRGKFKMCKTTLFTLSVNNKYLSILRILTLKTKKKNIIKSFRDKLLIWKRNDYFRKLKKYIPM